MARRRLANCTKVGIAMSFVLGAPARAAMSSRFTSAFVRSGSNRRRAAWLGNVNVGADFPPRIGRHIKYSSLPLAAQHDDNSDLNQVQPTWTYVPYDPSKQKIQQPQRRSFSTWTVPKSVDIPEDRLDISFVRSSGAGGQNVNKVNTKVEIRFKVDEADWIPWEVRGRLKEQQSNRINKDGYFSLQAQEFRTQTQNRKAAISKLQEMLLQAWPRPKVRKQRKGISKAAKERNKEFKKKRSDVKARRKKVDY